MNYYVVIPPNITQELKKMKQPTSTKKKTQTNDEQYLDHKANDWLTPRGCTKYQDDRVHDFCLNYEYGLKINVLKYL
jgi:hypothetical protein